MQHERALLLQEAAAKTAHMFSNKARAGNVLNETFSVGRIVALGEATAAVVFNKEPTGKRAVAWYYFVNSGRSPRWEHFFISYAHLASLSKVKDLLHEVEQHNFGLNVKPSGSPATRETT